jgi:ABC-2 type transport system ATP-binding protein
MLQVLKISKSFGSTKAVKQLELNVRVGQIHGLLGPNGAGKSTTIRMICGVLAPTSGRVKIDGVNLATNPSAAKRLLGYVPEGAPLPIELVPNEYLRYTASMFGIHKKERDKLISYWADRCDISDVLFKPIGNLSRGYRQRVSLASALVHNPKLLVLDEPSSGFDPAQNAKFRLLLNELSETTAIIYSSHHLPEVEATCDSVSIINHGNLLFDGELTAISSVKPSLVVEVSPPSIAEQLNVSGITKIDSNWVRCSINATESETIASKVSSLDGIIRLIQPEAESLESNYLRIISESEGAS